MTRREVPDEQTRPELAFVSRDLPLPDVQEMAPDAPDQADRPAARLAGPPQSRFSIRITVASPGSRRVAKPRLRASASMRWFSDSVTLLNAAMPASSA